MMVANIWRMERNFLYCSKSGADRKGMYLNLTDHIQNYYPQLVSYYLLGSYGK